MGYTALYRVFRPKTFSEVVGQDHIKTTLKNQIKSNRVGHAYLLNGTRGTGKTSIAKILARAVNCENPQDGEPCNKCELCKAILEGSLTDVVEMDAASNNGVEDIREIRNEVNFLPTRAKYRVYIIDEVHMLSTEAFNALLKTLEEPPEHVKFILATTEPQKIPATILSRCQRFDFKKISNENIVKRLEIVCEQSNVKISQEALNLIAVLSEGAMRDALSILERCIQDGENDIGVDQIKDLVGIPKLKYIYGILDAIVDNNVENAIDEINEVIADGKDLANFLWEIIKYTKDVLIAKVGKKLELYNNEELEQINSIAEKVSKERLLKIIYKLSELENDIKQSSQKLIIFQAGIINLCISEDSKGLEERIKALEEKVKNLTVSTTVVSSEIPQRAIQSTVINTVSTPVKEKKIEEKRKKETSSIQTANLKSQAFWPNILQELKSKGKVMLYANLLNSRAVEINDMTIGIEFANGLNDFRRKLLENTENIQELEKLVSMACGKPMQIKYIDKPVGNIESPKVEEKSRQELKTEKTKEEVGKVNSLEDLAGLGLNINFVDE